jgi:hypothetical protein
MKSEVRWVYMDLEYEKNEFTPKKWHTNMLGINGFFGG